MVVVNMAVPVVPAATEPEQALDTSSRAAANKADKEDLVVDLEAVSEEDSVDTVAREVKLDMEDKVDSEVCSGQFIINIQRLYLVQYNTRNAKVGYYKHPAVR